MREFSIYNNTYTKFGFVDRIRILFGKEISISLDIKVDQEVNVISSNAKTSVEHFLKRKPILMELDNNQNQD